MSTRKSMVLFGLRDFIVGQLSFLFRYFKATKKQTHISGKFEVSVISLRRYLSLCKYNIGFCTRVHH